MLDQEFFTKRTFLETRVVQEEFTNYFPKNVTGVEDQSSLVLICCKPIWDVALYTDSDNITQDFYKLLHACSYSILLTITITY